MAFNPIKLGLIFRLHLKHLWCESLLLSYPSSPPLAFLTKKSLFIIIYPSSGGGPIHAHVPIHAHPWIYPKPRRLQTKLPMYMINLIIIYDMVNMFCMKK